MLIIAALACDLHGMSRQQYRRVWRVVLSNVAYGRSKDKIAQSLKRASSAEAETASQDEDQGGDDEDIQPFFATAFSEPENPLQLHFAN